MRVTHVTSCAVPIHGNQHSQQPKNYENQKRENKMEGDTEDATVQGLIDREIDLISRKVLRKIKERFSKEEIY